MRETPRGGASGTSGAPVSVSILNSLAGLKEGSRVLSRWLADARVGREAENKAHLVYDEIVTNIIRYAFPGGDEHAIDISFALTDGGLRLVFEDDGIAFDPCTAPGPRKAGTLAEAAVGGRGLLLVRNAARSLRYERTPSGRNKLTVALTRD